MAEYKARLTTTRPYQGVEAVLYTLEGVQVDTDVTDERGLYHFKGIDPGQYEVRFFGRNYGEEDYITISVFDNAAFVTQHFIRPLDGTAFKSGGPTTLTFELVRFNSGAQEIVTSGDVKLYLKSGGSYQTIQPADTGVVSFDGYTLEIDETFVNGSVNLYAANAPANIEYDSVTVADVQDGKGFVSWVEASSYVSSYNPATDTFTPSGLTITPHFALAADQIDLDLDSNFTFNSLPTEDLANGVSVNSATGVVNVDCDLYFDSQDTLTMRWEGQYNDEGTVYTSAVTESVYSVKQGVQGTDGYTVILTNESHTFPAENDGTVTSYVGGGTQIIVYEGATKLTHNTGTLSDGQYKVTVSSTSNITAGTISTNGANNAEITAPTNMTADIASITFNIEVDPSGGESNINFTRQQSFTVAKKGAEGPGSQSVVLEASRYTIRYDSTGTETPAAQSVDLTATEQNHSGTVYYDFLIDGVSKQNSTSNTYTIPDSSEPGPNDTIQARVVTRQDSPTNPTITSDSISIIGIQDGEDPETVNLTANKYVITYDSTGTESPGGQSIDLSAATKNHVGTVYYEFLVGGVSKQNTTTSTYTILDADEPGPVDSIEVEVKTREGADNNPVIATDTISIYGTKAGTDAITVIMPNEAHTFAADADGNVSNYTGGGTKVIVYQGNTRLTHDTTGLSDGEYLVTVSGNTNILPGSISTLEGDGLIGPPSGMTADSATILYQVEVDPLGGGTNELYTKQQSFSLSKDGADAEVVKLTSDKYVITYDGAGNESPSGQTMNLTASEKNHFGDVYYEFLVDGVSKQNTTTSTYTILDGDEPGPTDSIEVEVRTREGAFDNPVLATDTISLFGTKAGADGNSAFIAFLTNEAHTFPADVNGNVTDYTGGGTKVLSYEGSTKLTHNPNVLSDGEYQVTVSGSTNITPGTISTLGGEAIVADPSNMTSDNATITYNVEIDPLSGEPNQTFSRQQSFSSSKDGPAGENAITIVMSNSNHTFPADVNGDVTDYTGGDTTITVYEGLNKLTHNTGVLSDGEFKVTVNTATNISAATPTTDGNGDAFIDDPSAMTAETASITFDIEVDRLSGGANETYTQKQSFTIAKEGIGGDSPEVVTLTADKYIITYNQGGSEDPPGQQINLTATAKNHTGTTYYEFIIDGQVQARGDDTIPTYTLPDGEEPLPNGVVNVTVNTHEGGLGNPVVATDSISLYGTKAGSDAITILMTNENHTFAADQDGNVTDNYVGGGTKIIAYQGNNKLTADSTGLNNGEY